MPGTELCKCDPDGCKAVMNIDDDGNDYIENNQTQNILN